MLNWSIAKYRFTFGLGSLAHAGVMAELWKEFLPIWAVLMIATLPLGIFLLADPRDLLLPIKIVRSLHVFAAIWYIVVTIVITIGLMLAPTLPKGWQIYPIFCLAGLVPSLFVLVAAARGRYPTHAETRNDDSAVQ